MNFSYEVRERLFKDTWSFRSWILKTFYYNEGERSLITPFFSKMFLFTYFQLINFGRETCCHLKILKGPTDFRLNITRKFCLVKNPN